MFSVQDSPLAAFECMQPREAVWIALPVLRVPRTPISEVTFHLVVFDQVLINIVEGLDWDTSIRYCKEHLISWLF